MTFIHPITQKSIPDWQVGVIAPMFTPVDAEGRIDEAGLQAYTDWLADDPNITALFWRSGVGCMYTFTMEEVKRGLEIVIDAAGGRKPVFCGAAGIYNGDFSRKADPRLYLEQSIELAEFSRDNGARAAVLVIPASLPVPPESSPLEVTMDYFKAVQDAVEIPLILYNPQNLPPEFQSTPELIRQASALPRVTCMKLSTTDLHRMSNIIDSARDNDFNMIAGSECAYYQAILTGAAGVVGQGCSAYPAILRRILDAILAGDFASALQAQFDVNRALEGFQGLPPDISGFAYLRQKGLQVSPYCRTGDAPLGDPIEKAIYEAIEPINRRYV
ncbi:MAG: dihydrodipicolinate synthase family protein [Candidatus Omnitrophica bacterium]|nr:dihydrodipicolinate synthase family protein [Candidatus Omnitrophota bacterium]